MRSTLAITICLCAVARVAAAQPAATPPDPGTTTATTPAEPPPPPPPPPLPPPPQVVEHESLRPDGMSVGIGLGYALPTNLQQPNTTSVRFRLASGLTFEPMITLGGTNTSTDDGMGNKTTNKTSELDLGANVRIPHRVRDRVDLVLVGAAAIGVVSTDPQGDNNNTSSTEFSLRWGLGLDYWIGRHFAVSMTATNPLLLSKKDTMQTATGNDSTQTTTTFGLIWNPNVILMGHMFF